MTSAALLLSLAALDPTVAAVNAERARRALPPLASSVVLERSSDRFADRLARSGRFAHDARIRVDGGRFSALGEALARGDGLSPADAVRAWMDSPPHRRLVLSPRYTHVGAGAARAGGTTIRVLHLAR
ncbi:CAP domain-containing protein [Solirubrobacter sp. CPCC 204708]|uniref:CAP domain-containing protein n=1 Tax=Solirubrobacter deserti TaxID=2282478 RepID=A0ABT4RKK1_9ACTN|nr:CAP domain-containing protein [Solirubrobacter deserti]MBE2317296.1 CAP domain-containing protein [Solirubrobacter deserti]MDA0139025.1 CAP domain-containing protein [Solirubrobacter deserti]